MTTLSPELKPNRKHINRSLLSSCAGLVCALLFAAASVQAQNVAWPQFRGPESNPVGKHAKLDTKPNQDLGTPEAIVSAFFASGSGPAGPRDFERMRSLFAPGARLITIRRPPAATATPNSRSIDQYVDESRSYLAANGNFESIKKVWIEQYANLAHVFCSFEARKSPSGEVSYRGVGSFQLMWDGSRWWILTAYWQGERPGEPLPGRYRD